MSNFKSLSEIDYQIIFAIELFPICCNIQRFSNFSGKFSRHLNTGTPPYIKKTQKKNTHTHKNQKIKDAQSYTCCNGTV